MIQKRLETAKLAGRDLAFLHDAHPDFVEQTQQRQAALTPPAHHGGVALARMHRVQRMIAAFGPQNDGVAVSPILPPG